jgi:1-phosphofructokinase family hexose kinase
MNFIDRYYRTMLGTKFLVVCLNPVIQNTLVFGRLAKGEVNRTDSYRVDASGKGVNVARVLGQIGDEAIQLTQLGGPTRDWFLEMCEADGLHIRWVESNSEIRVCTTIIDRSDKSATELVEEARPVGPGTAERTLAEYERALPDCEAVIISGTKAAGFPADTIPSMARLAAGSGKRLYLDIKGTDLLACLPYRPVAVKPNLEELLQTRPLARGTDLCSGVDEGSLRKFVAAVGREYAETYGTSLIVTRGSMSTWYWASGELRECQARKIDALNPIGSGDSFTAGLAASLEQGASLPEAVAEGSRLGALNAERLKPGSIA